MHTGILEYRRARWFKLSLVLLVAAVAVYVTQDAATPPNGGTWQGYTLGGVAATLVIWLSLLGVRKRRYRSTLGTVAGWTSAHVYLGAGVVVVATLHSAGQLGWNIHTLAYALVCLVVASGFAGIYLYAAVPRKSLENRDGRSRDALLGELGELDERGRQLASVCGTDIAVAAQSAIRRTEVGGGVVSQLRRRDRSSLNVATAGDPKYVENRDQKRILAMITERIPAAKRDSEVQALQELLSVMGRRQNVVRRLARDVQLDGLLRIWLYLHVPLTVVLLFALTIHVASVFLYW